LLLAIDRCATLLDVREHAARALAEGYEGIEWVLPNHVPDTDADLRSLPDPGVLCVRALAVNWETHDVDAAVWSLTSRLRLAAALGANVLNVGIPPLARDSRPGCFTSYQHCLNFAYELLQRTRWPAESAGVAVALEAPADGCLLSPVELRNLIDMANSSAVGACIVVARIEPIGSAGDWMETLAHHTHAVRIPQGNLRKGSSDVGAAPVWLRCVPQDRPMIIETMRLADRITPPNSAPEARLAGRPPLAG
jgi:hypothetical protein